MPPQQIGLQGVWNNAQFQAGHNQYITLIKQATGATQQAAGKMSLMGNVLSGALGTALGFLAARALPAAIDRVNELGSAVIHNVATLQDLTVALETLAARELVTSGAVADMNEGLAEAGPLTQSLLRQIRDLSIISPFEFQDIVKVFNMNVAFGQSIDTSLRLTKALTDMASVNKHIPGVLERVTYNFSQMSLVGKITMRDIRDLAQAGVDFSRVLREEMGMSIEEVNEALQSGKITFRDVSEAFIQYAEHNFGGAAERASRTLSGLASSFKDLAFFASADIFAPGLQRIADHLGRVLDVARAFVDSGILQDAGFIFEQMVDAALGSAEELPKVTAESFASMRQQFQNFAVEAAQYGANITVSFASGIIQGASAVIDAIIYIGRIIASWLSPGSPPKVLPKLPEWGMGAMMEYLKGFAKADFDILKTIQSPLKQALDILERTGKIGIGEAGSRFADLSAAMASALTGGGEFDKAIIDRIRKAVGPFGDAISDLASAHLGLKKELQDVTDAELAVVEAEARVEEARKGVTAAEERVERARIGVAAAEAFVQEAREAEAEATDRLRAAEDALEAARDRQEAATVAVADKTREYNNLLRAGANENVLRAKLAEINAAQRAQQEAVKGIKVAEDQVERAEDNVEKTREQVEEAQKGVDTARKQVDIAIKQREAADAVVESLQSQVKARENILDQQQKELEQLREQVRLREELVRQLIQLTQAQIVQPEQPEKPPVGAGSAPATPATPGLEIPGIPDIPTVDIDEATQNFRDKIAEIFKNARAELEKEWNKSSLKKALDNLGELLFGEGDFKERAKNFFMDFLGLNEQDAEFWAGKLDEFKTKVGEVFSEENLSKAARWAGILLSASVSLGLIVGFMLTLIGLLIQLKGFLGGGVPMFAGLDVLARQFGSDIMIQGVLPKLEELGQLISEKWEEYKGIISTKIDETKAAALEKWELIRADVAAKVEELRTNIETTWTTAKENASTKWGEIRTTIGGAVDSILAKMGLDLDSLKRDWGTVHDNVESIAKGVWQRTKANIVEKTGEIKADVEEKIGAVKTWLDDRWNEIKTKVEDTWNPIYDFITEKILGVKTDVEDKVGSLRDDWNTKWQEIHDKVVELVGKIFEAVESKMAEVKQKVIEKITEAKDAIGGMVKDFFSAGADLIQGLIDGILSKAGNVVSTITKTAVNVTNEARKKWGSDSPSKVFRELGKTAPWGLEMGIKDYAQRPQMAMQAVAGRAFAAAAHPIIQSPRSTVINTGGNTYNRNLSLDMGGQVVQNGMDIALIRAVVSDVLRTEFA